MPKFEVSIAEPTLLQMEEDAGKAKAELNLVAHVRTLVAEVRRLAQQVEEKPTVDQAHLAMEFVKYVAQERSGMSQDRPLPPDGLAHAEVKAVAVIERFLS